MICAGPFREVCVGKKCTRRRETIQQLVIMEGDMGELFTGKRSSKSQTVTKTEKKYVGYLFRRKRFICSM